MRSDTPKNSLIIPACIIAGGLIFGAFILRAKPASDHALPTLGANANVTTPTSAKPPEARDPSLLGSLDSSFVKEVNGDLVTLAYSPGRPKKHPEIVLRLTPETKYFRSERVADWNDHLLKAGDLIDFTPTDFDENLTVVDAESVTLISRPEPPPDVKK